MIFSRTLLPLGITHYLAFPETLFGEGPVVESLRVLAGDPEFAFIELTHIADPGARGEAAALLHEHKKRFAFNTQPMLHAQRLNLAARGDARQAAVDAVKRAIDEATEMDAETLVFPAGADPGEARRHEAIDGLQKSVFQIHAHARTTNRRLRLLLAPSDRVPFGDNALFGPTEEAVAFVEAVREYYAKFALLIDLANLPLLGETPDYTLTIARTELGSYVRAGNCVMRDAGHPAYGNRHPPLAIAAGEIGVPELAEFLKALVTVGYLNTEQPGTVCFAVKPLFGQNARTIIDHVKKTIDLAWELL